MSLRETIKNARHALLRDKNLQGDTLTMHPLTWRRIMHEGPLELFHLPNERPTETSYMGYKIVEAKIMPVNRISVKRAGLEIGVIALDGDVPDEPLMNNPEAKP